MKILNHPGKLLLTFLLLFAQVTSISQEKISLSVYQDARLMVLGDTRSNEPGTLNIIMNMKIQTKQKAYGYLVIVPEYEQANIQDTFKRLSLGVGYTFNRFSASKLKFLHNFEITTTMYYGVINRFSNSEGSWSSNAEMSYKVNEWLKIAAIHQLTERTDLLYRYQDNTIRYSFFLGLEFSPINFGKSTRNSRWYAAL